VFPAPPPPPAIDREHAQRCLAACGIRERLSELAPCAGGITNANYKVTLMDGRNVLLRLYRWPHAEPDLERGRKEAFLHGLLLRNGVPVPNVHGVAPDGTCLVMEWIDGLRLRDVVGTADGDLSRAWAEAGAALRLTHTLQPFGEPGVITGSRLEPFDLPWGEFHADLIRRHASALRGLDRINDAQHARIDAAALLAARTLAIDRQVRLLHNDPHGSNVLVRKEGGQWRLAGWIDWEYAWMGDPAWDLARFDVFTTAQAGLVDQAFWSGYGRSPDLRTFPFYELHVMVWLGSLRNPRPTALTAAASAYVSQIDGHLDAIGV
jgi:aminoglycoside phosphotransferase (APT) family kinase protein